MILPMMSAGAFVPLAVLPDGVQRLMNFSPIRHMVDLMQGLWNGDPRSDYGPATAMPVGMIVIFGALGARLFKWKAA